MAEDEAGRRTPARPRLAQCRLWPGDFYEVAREGARRARATGQVRHGLVAEAVDHGGFRSVLRCPAAVVRPEEGVACGVVLRDVLAEPNRPICDVQRRLAFAGVALGSGAVLGRLDERRRERVGAVVPADPVDLERADGGNRDDAGSVAEV